MAANLGFKCTKRKQKTQNEVRYSPYFAKVSSTTSDSAQSAANGNLSNRRNPVKERKKGKFGDKTEEDVMKLLLPDRLGDNLDILFVGINPGLMSAYKGHHYCGATNHFWPCLIEAGLVPKGCTYLDDSKCPSYGIGLTNIVARTTRSSSDLTRSEIKEGRENLIEKIKQCTPLVTCFNGKGIYEIFSSKKSSLGRQPENVPGTNSVVYVMPSSSARTISFPRKQDKYRFYHEVKELRDQIKNNLLTESEIQKQ